MFEVYAIESNGRLGDRLLRTATEGAALDLLNRLRGSATSYLYAVNGAIHHEHGPNSGTINFWED